jgi:hypothetical protein
MQAYAYQVVYIDYRGRISTEGRETLITNERRTTFVRRYLDGLGREGWELVGIQPLSPHTAYYVFKRPDGAMEHPEETTHAARTEPSSVSTPPAAEPSTETL